MCKVTKKKDNIYFHVIISTVDMSKKKESKKLNGQTTMLFFECLARIPQLFPIEARTHSLGI